MPSAQNDDERMLAMMNAAIDRHRKDWPDAVSVRLWDSYENDSTVRIRIVYAPDGCGWPGDPCDQHLWTEYRHFLWTDSRKTIPEEFINYGLPTKKERKASRDLVCRRGLACWAKKHHVDAEVTCQYLIENHAKYDHEWTSWTALEKWLWGDKKKGTIKYGGDNVKFQNGFGAWQKMYYWCTFDPNTQRAEAQVFAAN